MDSTVTTQSPPAQSEPPSTSTSINPLASSMDALTSDTTTTTPVSTPATNTTTDTSADQPSSSSSSQPPSQPQQCAHCHTLSSAETTLKPCTKCHTTLYCSKTCLKADAKPHKKVCASLAQTYAQTAEFRPATGSRPPPREGYQKGLRKWQFDT